MIITPAELPFAPRPCAEELLSSWLLRVAAANLVSLRELLDGFTERYGDVLTNVPIDCDIPEAALITLSQFCRVVPEKIRALDLRHRAPHLSSSLLLRYHPMPSLWWCPRCSFHRVRYAFCPLCLSSQRVIHVRWDWSIACLIRCVVHRIPLRDGCPACGELDPITFSGFDLSRPAVCRSCGSDLTANLNNTEGAQRKCDIQAVEDAYRTMLLGIAPNPTLLGKATDKAFRRFVEDMLRLLTHSLNLDSPWRPARAVPFSRRDVLQIITALIENAAPGADQRTRSRRYSRGLVLWAMLLGLVSDLEGDAIEQSSRHWPVSLRRRFVSAKYYRVKKRWPYSPYGRSYGRRIERREIARIYGLPVSPRPLQISTPIGDRLNFVSYLDVDPA